MIVRLRWYLRVKKSIFCFGFREQFVAALRYYIRFYTKNAIKKFHDFMIYLKIELFKLKIHFSIGR